MRLYSQRMKDSSEREASSIDYSYIATYVVNREIILDIFICLLIFLGEILDFQ